MQNVFVLSSIKQALMPCHPSRARSLLKQKKAAVYRMSPFTIILLNRTDGDVQSCRIKVDSGSKQTGIAIVIVGKYGSQVKFGANLMHRGKQICDALNQRRAIRRSRRTRKLRYRQARFDNRTRTSKWLTPSMRSRVNNTISLIIKLTKLSPVIHLSNELVRFDMQKLRNPEISGVLYQQGTLFGTELREYLLTKYNYTCVYCCQNNLILEVDHVIPKSKGGTNAVTNLVIACTKCNTKKSNQDIETFLADNPTRLQKIKTQLKTSLTDAAAVNTIRNALTQELYKFELPLETSSGGVTKFNRIQQGYGKDHWVDAACIGDSGSKVTINPKLKPLTIRAIGRGSRQMCRVNKYGFPRTTAKQQKQVYGFQSGDLVKAVVTNGKKKGTYYGKVAVRITGNFNITTKSAIIQGINYKYCKLIQKQDGYLYL